MEKGIKGNESSIQEVIEKARKQIAEEADLSPALRATFELLINLVLLLVKKRLPKMSKNSNTPLSADPNREKKAKIKTGRKPGGQFGHTGTQLHPVENPDTVIQIKMDRRKLPAGEWKSAGFEKRQIFEMEIKRIVYLSIGRK
jgi:transposase